MFNKIISRCLLIGCLLFSNAYAAIKLPALVGDNMILQRNVKVPVWGWADPGEKIRIKFNKKEFKTTTGTDGKWYLQLGIYKAGGPYEMQINGDKSEILIKNILIGDVFVCSGQSNMEATINRGLYAAEMANSANDNIRQFKVNHMGSDTVRNDLLSTTCWLSASPATVGGFTAVGYFFAADLYAKIKVPIGIINTSYGSALIEAWTSREGLKDFPAFYTQPKAKNEQSVPMYLYNAMLAPITNYAIKGIVWYQGEFNSGRAYQYRTLLPAMITDWRTKFKQGDLPFIIVQLPNYDAVSDVPKESKLAELREAQAMALSLPNTAIAVTIETNSTGELHPKEKKPVGVRVSLAAQKLIYGQNIIASGPMYKSNVISGNKIIISFDNASGKLKAADGELKQFTIAGADHKFVFATAVIVGNTVEVSSPEVTSPVAVRYAWADNPKGANLYNAANLPAAPFRTDDWPGITKPK
jgi:sialate O-acetylesterase